VEPRASWDTSMRRANLEARIAAPALGAVVEYFARRVRLNADRSGGCQSAPPRTPATDSLLAARIAPPAVTLAYLRRGATSLTRDSDVLHESTDSDSVMEDGPNVPCDELDADLARHPNVHQLVNSSHVATRRLSSTSLRQRQLVESCALRTRRRREALRDAGSGPGLRRPHGSC